MDEQALRAHTADDRIHPATNHYPPAEITAAEFEVFVSDVLREAAREFGGATVEVHDVIEGDDGTYDFDATARFSFAGMDFLVLVEAKRHKNPIKRELVQVLHSKLQSVGAQKAVMFSTAPYQSGALTFATRHGIALATVTEGRFTYEVKSAVRPPAPSREEAAAWFDLPTFCAHGYSPDATGQTIGVSVFDSGRPDFLADYIAGRSR